MAARSSTRSRVSALEALVPLSGRGGGGSSSDPGVIASVATPALLTPISIVNALDGAEAFVTIQRSRWKLQTSAFALDGVTVVATPDAARQWVRDLSYVDPLWIRSTGYFIDPANSTGLASDTANTGLSAILPLSTWAEFARRTGMNPSAGECPTFIGAVIVKWLSSQGGAGDPVFPIYRLGPSASFTLQGVPTVVALTGGGTMSGVVARNRATNTPNKITNAGFTGANDWTALLDLQVHNITQDTISYPWFNNGGKEAWMTEPMRKLAVNSIALVDVVNPNANTNTFEVLRPPTIFLAGWSELPQSPGTFTTWQGISGALDMKLSSFGTTTAPVCINVSNPFFAQCQWDIGDVQFTQQALPYLFCRLYNCAFSNLGIINGLTLIGTNSLRVSYGVVRCEIAVTASQGPFIFPTDNQQTSIEGDCILTANQPLISGPGGFLYCSNIAYFPTVGGGAGSGMAFSSAGRIHFDAAVWGNAVGTGGAMGAFAQMGTGGWMTYKSGVTGTWTVAGLAGIGGAGQIFAFQGGGANGQKFTPGTGIYDGAAANSIARLISTAAGTTEGLHAPQFDIHFMPA